MLLSIRHGKHWLSLPKMLSRRLLSIPNTPLFDAFSRELALPPIEVVEAKGKDYRYWLYHGRHRLAASIAVGFPIGPETGMHSNMQF
jgi:hypothetical protein